MLSDASEAEPQGGDEFSSAAGGTGVHSINWNRPSSSIDLDVWNKQTSNFWLPEKIPLSNDKRSWDSLSPDTRRVVTHSLASLTRLDTLQAKFGAPVLAMSEDVTPHESANLSFFAGMEAVHARSYSSIFSTLLSSEEIEEAFELADNDKLLTQNINTLLRVYESYKAELPMKCFYSVMLESFLFYTGFYPVLKLASEGKLTNTADIIRLIMRDEAIHGFYIGGIFERTKSDPKYHGFFDVPGEFFDHIRQVVYDLYTAERRRIEYYYGWSDHAAKWIPDAMAFLSYNAQLAASNLGDVDYAAYTQSSTIGQPSPAIMSQLSTVSDETHDFFSGSGSSYIIGKVEELSDEDWA